MREIKFRGLDKRGVWHYGFFWKSPDGTYWIKENDADYQIIKETLGQYIGLKDKNGKSKEIYEGDLLVEDGADCCLEVYWSQTGACYYITNNEDNENDFVAKLDIGFTKKTRVIGNIYQNQELIK